MKFVCLNALISGTMVRNKKNVLKPFMEETIFH